MSLQLLFLDVGNKQIKEVSKISQLKENESIFIVNEKKRRCIVHYDIHLEQETEAGTSSGYTSLLNRTGSVPAEYMEEALCKLTMTPRTMWMGAVKCAQIWPMSTCRMVMRNHPMNAMMYFILYMVMEK